jgi:hypothetical protein
MQYNLKWMTCNHSNNNTIISNSLARARVCVYERTITATVLSEALIKAEKPIFITLK